MSDIKGIKTENNLLAAFAGGDTHFFCSHCSGPVPKSADHCPHCSVQLSAIRCPACDFMGNEEDFLLDRCPKCGCGRLLAV